MITPLKQAIITIRQQRPLVLNLTNYVTMDFMANALLAIGAAPIMTVCHEELEELIQLSHSININIGTLDNDAIKRFSHAARLSRQYHKPAVLDPVGAGASRIRTQIAQELLPFVDIVRGNASEIMALAGVNHKTQGVESANSTAEAQQAARQLARQHAITVVVSGAVDFIVTGEHEEEIPFGSPVMPLVTGMGCTLSAVIAAFAAVMEDRATASILATRYFTLCGTLAQLKSPLPASFRTHFIDYLYQPDFEQMQKESKSK